MKPRRKKLIASYVLAIVTTVVFVGTIDSCLLSSFWNEAVHDVGESNAMIFLAILHLVYAVPISIGTIIFVVKRSSHGERPNIYTCVISAAMSILIVDFIGSYLGIGWLMIIFGMPIIAWVSCNLIYFFDPARQKRTHE